MAAEPAARWGHFSAPVDGQVYVYGGRTEDSLTTSTVSVFNSYSESWRKAIAGGSPPPGLYKGGSLYNGASVGVGPYIYVYGGHDGLHFHGSLHQLNTTTLKWSQLHTTAGHWPMRKVGCGMVRHGDHLILFGGYGYLARFAQHGAEFVKHVNFTDGRGWSNELHSFRLKEGPWSSPTVSGTRPPPCSYFSLTKIDDHCAVLFGGHHCGRGLTNDVYILDLTRMHWSTLAHQEGEPCPVGRGNHAAVCLGYGGDSPQVVVIGGMADDCKILNDMWALDIQSGRWREVKEPRLQPRCWHSATAITHSPGQTEVILFGGCPEWPKDATISIPQMADTTVLQFEHLHTGGIPTREWVLTDLADSSQLGTIQRIGDKMVKMSQATHTSTATPVADDISSNDSNGDFESGDEDDEADEEIEPDKFIQEIEEAMSRNETISRKLAHGMFVGPTGTGKSSLMDRLLGRARKEFSPSTGVSESVVVVDVGIDNPSTFHSVTVESNIWKEVEYDVSLVRHMEEGVITSQPASLPSLPPTDATQSPNGVSHSPTESALQSSPVPVSLSSPHSPPQTSEIAAKPATTAIKKPPIKEVIRLIVVKYGGYKKFKRFLKKTFSLYLRDTGGQVEFQEMLPLLIFGPSIFFFVFRLDLDFKKKFTVEYRKSVGESLNCYTSSITTEEAFFQCLASVYAMDVPGLAGVKTHRPLVFIIGTHKDKLGPLADEKIATLNQYLSILVKKSGFDDLVLSADRDKGQVMFTVDNTSDSDEDFKPIRARVNSLVSGRPEFTIEYPISYLLFCLELQNVKRSILSLAECKVMAAKFGIEGDQLLHLLQFLHLRIGVIRYFDKDGVRHIVIKEPQVLFNRVTSLIIKTFSCKALTDKEVDDFEKKGILTESAFASIVSGDGNLTPEEFLRLLVHLRIIALFTSQVNLDKEKRYFIPSVLNHVPECSEEDPKTHILPLVVKFKCEHCPKGLFGVLVTHLMTPDLNKEATSTTTFTLMQDKIFKNQVSFEVHSPGVQDEMALLVHPSHLEIKFFPEDAEHSEDRDTSIAEVCNEVRQILETSICSALKDLHYNISNVEPVMCIRCEKCSDLHEVKKGKKSWKIHCKKIKRSVCVATHGRCWFNEGFDSEVSSRATADKPAIIPPPLTHVAVTRFLEPLTNVEIRRVGLELGLRRPRLKKMKEDTLLDDMLDSWLREDDDVSETSGTPSWESLAKALEEAGYNGVAANIRKENVLCMKVSSV